MASLGYRFKHFVKKQERWFTFAGGQLIPAPEEEGHRAQDRQPKAETYQQMVDRVRGKALSGK